MKTSILLPLASMAALSVAQDLCGQYDYYSSNGFNFNNNLWGQDAGSGSGCLYPQEVYDTGAIFATEWSWSGSNNNVKAYPNIGVEIEGGQLLSEISSMPAEVYWSYAGTDIRADVSFDLFSASDPNHDTSYGEYELMIWLAQIGGVDPIGSAVGSANLGGIEWTVWYGVSSSNGQQTYSFVPTNGAWLESFQGDVIQFWNWLRDNRGYPASSQYLLTHQFGTEPFTGSACYFAVSWFAATVN